MIDETKNCIYCGEQKQLSEFSLEHIWPDALGGDCLSEFWQTRDVCRKCNNISGVFVDGAFIKHHLVSNERMLDGLAYLSPESSTGTIPLGFCGTVQNIQAPDGEEVDFWVCAPGANVLHFRAQREAAFDAYVGGIHGVLQNVRKQARSLSVSPQKNHSGCCHINLRLVARVVVWT